MSYSLLPLSSKLFKFTALSLALSLAACGGGDGGGDTIAPEPDTGITQPGGGGDDNGGGDDSNESDESATQVNQIYLSAEKNQLLTGGDSTTVEIRAIDKNGGIVENVPVTINISNAAQYGLSIRGSSTQTTNENGLINIVLEQSSVGIDSRLDHESLLTVTAGNMTQTLPIRVSGTRADNIVASKNSVTATDNFSVSGRIIDGKGSVITNTSVALYNDGKEIATRTTDNNGEFVFDTSAAMLTAVDGGYNFSLEIRGNQTTQRITDLLKIAAADSSDVTFTPTSDIKVNDPQPITLTLPNVNDGETVVLSTNKGKILVNENDASPSSRRTFTVKNNKVVFYVESNVPGNAKITAQYAGTSRETTINFVSVKPTKLLLQIERAVINTGGTTQVIAKVLDKDDAAVKNAIVQFTTTKDASGGSLSPAFAYTDNNGQAIVEYNAGQNPTATDGVVIEAEVQAIKLPNGKEETLKISLPPVSSAITVQTKSTFISFAFANTVSSGDRDVYYFRKGSISVLNNTGKPAINQQVSVNLIPNKYGKGVFRVVKDPILDKEVWVRSPYIECSNEDKNNNGILDPDDDINDNGQLDPVNVVAVLDKDGNEVSTNSNQSFNLTTDAFGKIDFSVRYFKEYAQWYQAKITVNTRVDGSESQQARLIDFPVLVDDVDISVPMRPNMVSPFGTANSCRIAD